MKTKTTTILERTLQFEGGAININNLWLNTQQPTATDGEPWSLPFVPWFLFCFVLFFDWRIKIQNVRETKKTVNLYSNGNR